MTELIGVKGPVGTTFVRPQSVIAVQASPMGGTAVILEGGHTIITHEPTTVVAGRISKSEGLQRSVRR